MKPELIIILSIFIGFALLEAFTKGFFKKSHEKKGDAIVDVMSTLLLIGFTQPAVIICSGVVTSQLAPAAEGALSSIPLLAGIALFLIFDDMTQYWWHRTAHCVPWLYNLHRPHHNAEYLSVRVVYRNNFFYYFLMPGLWFSGALIYLGLGWVYAGYIIVKMTVIYGAHCDVKWDAPLYRIPWLSPVMWVVERTISTPATHSAHHGKYKADGITNYKGNYGNLLFFWDVLFGTAHITRRYPDRYGVENMNETSVGEQLLWPLVRVNQPKNVQEAPARAK